MRSGSTVVMIHDHCDYCLRAFGYPEGAPALCTNCGLENVRPAHSPETAMRAPAPERAVKPAPRPRGRRVQTSALF